MSRKTKAEAQQTREQVLDAAEGLFFANGVMHTSLEQIALAAGVTRGAVYWHFTDKVALFNALHERVRLPQEDLISQIVADGHPDPLGFLEKISLDCINTIVTDPSLMRVYTILLVRCEYVGDMHEALKRQQDADAAMHTNFVRIFTMARENGSLDPTWTPEVAAQVYASMIRGMWSDCLRYGHDVRIMQLWPKCTLELFQSFKARQSPTR